MCHPVCNQPKRRKVDSCPNFIIPPRRQIFARYQYCVPNMSCLPAVPRLISAAKSRDITRTYSTEWKVMLPHVYKSGSFGMGRLVQGDHSGWFKPPVDNETKVSFLYEARVLKHKFCFAVNRRLWSPCMLVQGLDQFTWVYRVFESIQGLVAWWGYILGYYSWAALSFIGSKTLYVKLHKICMSKMTLQTILWKCMMVERSFYRVRQQVINYVLWCWEYNLLCMYNSGGLATYTSIFQNIFHVHHVPEQGRVGHVALNGGKKLSFRLSLRLWHNSDMCNSCKRCYITYFLFLCLKFLLILLQVGKTNIISLEKFG